MLGKIIKGLCGFVEKMVFGVMEISYIWQQNHKKILAGIRFYVAGIEKRVAGMRFWVAGMKKWVTEYEFYQAGMEIVVAGMEFE